MEIKDEVEPGNMVPVPVGNRGSKCYVSSKVTDVKKVKTVTRWLCGHKVFMK